MTSAQRDQAVYHLLSRSTPNSIPDVLRVMDTMMKTLDADDGIRAFTLLYRMVTYEVHKLCEDDHWHDTHWMIRLDVEFAKLFFSAVQQWIDNPLHCPRAWIPLFEKRFDERVSPVQFGLAGINAHINRDLPIAIVRAQEQTVRRRPEKDTSEYNDYLIINDVLDSVELEALKHLATGWIKRASHLIDPIDKRAAMAAVSASRSRAWIHAGRYWDLLQEHPHDAPHYIERLDKITEGIGRTLLIPTYSR